MKKPDWFVLIEQWKARGMGQYGVTLPFLVGALGYKSGRSALSSNDIRDVLQEIVTNPVVGYVTEVRWCGNIDAPVFSVSRISDVSKMPLTSYFPAQNGEASLGFSQDLQSMFGLNCSGTEECLDKLIAHAASHVEKGHVSRMLNSTTGQHEYVAFSPKERQFIEDTIGHDAG